MTYSTVTGIAIFWGWSLLLFTFYSLCRRRVKTSSLAHRPTLLSWVGDLLVEKLLILRVSLSIEMRRTDFQMECEVNFCINFCG